MNPIKVFGLCTSPRKNQNTELLLDSTLQGCQSIDAEVEKYIISGKDLNPCKGCSACQKVKKCPIFDDITEILEKMKQADVIFIASPVFFYDITSQCKMIIDRSYAVQPLNQNKVGGILLTAGSMGGSSALSTLNMFYTVHGITNAGYVLSLGETEKNEKALQSAYYLGIKAVEMAKILKSAPKVFNAHTHYAYGTHTK